MNTAMQSRQGERENLNPLAMLSSFSPNRSAQEGLDQALENDTCEVFAPSPLITGSICKYSSTRPPHYLSSLDRKDSVNFPSDSGYSSLAPSANSSLSSCGSSRASKRGSLSHIINMVDTDSDGLELPDDSFEFSKSRFRRRLRRSWPEPSVLSLFDDVRETRPGTSHELDVTAVFRRPAQDCITRKSPENERLENPPDDYENDFEVPHDFGPPMFSSKLKSRFSSPPRVTLVSRDLQTPTRPLTPETCKRRNSMPEVYESSREKKNSPETNIPTASKDRLRHQLKRAQTLPSTNPGASLTSSFQEGPSSPTHFADDESPLGIRPMPYRPARNGRRVIKKAVPSTTRSRVRHFPLRSIDSESEDEDSDRSKRDAKTENIYPIQVPKPNAYSELDVSLPEDESTRALETSLSGMRSSLLQHLVNYALAECVDEPENNQSSNSLASSSTGRDSRTTSQKPSSATWGSSKRCRDSDRDPNGDGDDSDDDDDRPKKRNEKGHTGGIPIRRLKCPFYQRQPEKYLRAACRGEGFADMPKLKDHIKRVHTQPLRCLRCWEEMKSDDMYARHLQADMVCDKVPEPTDDRLRPELLKSLDFKKLPFANAKNAGEKWKILYATLFPNEREIPSPYDHHGVNSRLERALAGALEEELSKELANVLEPILARIKSRVPDIIQNCKLRLIRGTLDEDIASNTTSSRSALGSSEWGNSDSETASRCFSGGQTSRATSPFSGSGAELPSHKRCLSDESAYNNIVGLFGASDGVTLPQNSPHALPFMSVYPDLTLPDDAMDLNHAGAYEEPPMHQATFAPRSVPNAFSEDLGSLPHRSSPHFGALSETINMSTIYPKAFKEPPRAHQKQFNAQEFPHEDLENADPAVSQWLVGGTHEDAYDFSVMSDPPSDDLPSWEPLNQEPDFTGFLRS